MEPARAQACLRKERLSTNCEKLSDLHESDAESGSSEKVALRSQGTLTKRGVRYQAARELARLLPSYQRRSPGADARRVLPSCGGSYSAETVTGTLRGGGVARGPPPTDADRRRRAAPHADSDSGCPTGYRHRERAADTPRRQSGSWSPRSAAPRGFAR